MANRPLMSYSFLLTFEGTSSITKSVVNFNIDEAIRQFTIEFSVPLDYRDDFQKEIDSFTYFYLDEVSTDGTPVHTEIFHVDKILKKHRKYDYRVGEVVVLTLIGTYK